MSRAARPGTYGGVRPHPEVFSGGLTGTDAGPGARSGIDRRPRFLLGTTRHMAILVKDGLAMRLTLSTTRLARAAVLVAMAASAGCRRLPYIDPAKEVPHETMGTIAQEDKEVKQAEFLSATLPMAMPKVAKPRTTNDPETREIWQLTLQDASASASTTPRSFA